MNKDKALKFLTTAATIKELGASLDKEAGGIFCSFGDDKCIHLTEEGFNKIAEAMQATVTYNPNWGGGKYPDFLEQSFTVEIFEKKWFVFALADRREKRHDQN